MQRLSEHGRSMPDRVVPDGGPPVAPSVSERSPRRSRALRWLRVGFVPLGLLLVIVAGFVVPMPVYAQRPGASLDLTECLVVDDPLAAPVHGDVLLLFATYRRATVADLAASLVAEDIVLRPVERVVPDDVEPQEYFAQERLVFDTVGRTAAAVGLERAGYPEPARYLGDGARVVRTIEGLPAAGVLAPGDVIVGVNGHRVRTVDGLRRMIADETPLEITVHRDGHLDEVSITPLVRFVDGEERPLIGVELRTVNPGVELPVDIDLRAGRIGGPSAGLMIALDVYDAVSGEDLIGGRRIAGTGTIDANGIVGRIGALPLKVMAAHQQGAGLFLAPASQAEAARAALPQGSTMRIVGVETFDDALAALHEPYMAGGPLREVRFRECSEREVPAQAGGIGPESGAGVGGRGLFPDAPVAILASHGGQCRAGVGEVPCDVAT